MCPRTFPYPMRAARAKQKIYKDFLILNLSLDLNSQSRNQTRWKVRHGFVREYELRTANLLV